MADWQDKASGANQLTNLIAFLLFLPLLPSKLLASGYMGCLAAALPSSYLPQHLPV